MKKKFSLILRIVLGIIFVLCGIMGILNVFFEFAPAAQYTNPIANQFITGMTNTKYLPILINFINLVVGISLLVNRFVPLALILSTPFSVNIVLFHLFLDIQTIPPALVIAVINTYLLFVYIDQYKSLLRAKSS
ncbi:DoxX protein [Seinonella peptonophila]|uniref:DoxX protein n=1 Tax=Seinonella peptonophila TaxID=112248 RepID=A0A1M4ZPC9_9BACL|nr:DoxX family membrane protein [Seinonella peptonophila]SHF19893.1 DoxX protein [Seinonella peptonophila]